MARSVVNPGGGISVQLEPPLEFIMRQTGAFRAALLDLQALWELFKPVMSEIEGEQFSSQGQGAWPGLAESTISEKSQGGWPLDPLVRTGNLRESLIDPGRAAETGPQQMTWGSDVPYAAFHQTGTSKMPQRQVIADPFRVEDRRKLEVAMVTYVNTAARATFGRI